MGNITDEKRHYRRYLELNVVTVRVEDKISV